MSIPIKTKLSWPLSLSEAKRHLRVQEDFHDDDDYIQELIYAATAKAEQYIGKDIAETSSTQEIFDWCSDTLFEQEGNFLSFTQAVTDASVLLTVDNVHVGYNEFWVEFLESASADPLTISYKTGFSEGTCPALIKQAILVKIADLYDMDRQSYVEGISRSTKAFENLLDSFRLIMF